MELIMTNNTQVILQSEALTKVTSHIQSLGMSLEQSGVTENGKILYELRDSWSGKLLMRDLTTWVAYDGMTTGYFEALAKQFKCETPSERTKRLKAIPSFMLLDKMIYCARLVVDRIAKAQGQDYPELIDIDDGIANLIKTTIENRYNIKIEQNSYYSSVFNAALDRCI
ncbi:MAG: hypothetical protein Q4P13_05935 [Psychrobacter sp.]|nr:hypothetical protein [Psychrobacter sp.]